MFVDLSGKLITNDLSGVKMDFLLYKKSEQLALMIMQTTSAGVIDSLQKRSYLHNICESLANITAFKIDDLKFTVPK